MNDPTDSPAWNAFRNPNVSNTGSSTLATSPHGFSEGPPAENASAEAPYVGEAATQSPHSESFKSSFEGTIENNDVSAIRADEEDRSQQVRVRVSSKHLALASPVFRSMLQPKFQEGHELRLIGRTELPLPDDDSAALLVLLNVIHGRLREVPRKIDLRMLTEISILVDKYELLQATEILLDYWLPSLKATIPQVFNDDLLPWMCISWVFQIPDIWRQVTRTAERESKCFITEDRLPIPEWSLSMR